ncbi:hypothetical protein SAMN02745866_01095 [Alteromonadaceae bacterium Bs31]|nr:hypothetical protein SAMN02745866_01095 [Alteromonadaceae bacterium Bs31]
MQPNAKLVRKQFLVSADNVTKIERLAEEHGTSATEIVRQAIDAFEHNSYDAMAPGELMDLVSSSLKEAIDSTIHANARVEQTLNKLETTRG